MKQTGFLKRTAKYLLCLAFCVQPVFTQVQDARASAFVKGVDVKPRQLSCNEPSSDSSRATVKVEVVLEGKPPEGSQLKVSLAGFRLEPSTNRIVIVDGIKEVMPKGKITSVPFTVTCGPESENGVVTLFANVIEATQGIKMSQEFADPRKLVDVQVRKQVQTR